MGDFDGLIAMRSRTAPSKLATETFAPKYPDGVRKSLLRMPSETQRGAISAE